MPRSMSSHGEDRRPVAPSRRDAAADRRRRGNAKREREHERDVLRSPSYLAFSGDDGDRRSPNPNPSRRRAHRPNRYFDADVDRRSRSPSRSPSPRRRRRARSNSYRGVVEDESERSSSRSPSPRRRRRSRSNGYSDVDEPEADRRSRSRSRTPSPAARRRRARSNSYRDEDEPERRSPGRRRVALRSCRSRSRTRSEECEDSECCRSRPADEEMYMSPDEDDGFYVRINRSDDLFKCARCHDLLSPPVYECVEGHVTCASCHGAGNAGGGEGDHHRCTHCGSPEYGASRAVDGWLRSVRFACPNHEFGCPFFLPRRDMEAGHERACPYAPVFCPVRRCDFHGGPADALERHLTARHGWAVAGFRYGEPVRVRVHPSRSVLRAEDDGALFHLRADLEPGGTALSMIRIRPDSNDDEAAAEFTYEVRTAPAAEGMRHRLQMQSTVWGTSLGHGERDANPVCVTVPEDMFPLDGPDQDSVEVRVRKVAPPAAAARDDDHD